MPIAVSLAAALCLGGALASLFTPIGLFPLSLTAVYTQLLALPFTLLTTKSYLGADSPLLGQRYASLSAALLPVGITVLCGPWLAGWGGATILVLTALTFALLHLRA